MRATLATMPTGRNAGEAVASLPGPNLLNLRNLWIIPGSLWSRPRTALGNLHNLRIGNFCKTTASLKLAWPPEL